MVATWLFLTCRDSLCLGGSGCECNGIRAGDAGERIVLQAGQTLSEGIYVVIAGCGIDVLDGATDRGLLAAAIR